jgi:hypothetical protein
VTKPQGDFARYVQQLARETEAGLTQHPEPETLLAYHLGELDEATADGIAEHLTFCRACADHLLAIPSFLAEPEPSPEPVANPEPAANPEPVANPAPARPSAPPAPRATPLRRWWPLAAMLALGVGLGQLVPRPQPAPLRATFRVAVVEGDAPGARSGSDRELEVDLQHGEEAAVAVLTPRQHPGPGTFRALVRDRGGRVWLDESGLHPTALGTFLLSVPRGALPDEALEIVITEEGPEAAEVGRWTLRVLAGG